MHVILPSLITCCLATLLPAVAVPKPPPDKVSLEIVLASSKLRACDPLLVKVRLENNSREDHALSMPLGKETGTVKYEVRIKGDRDFVGITTPWTGAFCLAPLKIPAGSKHACYDVLFCSNKKIIFDKPGVYELRATVHLVGQKVEAAPFTVEVEAIPEQERTVIERDADFLERYLMNFCSLRESYDVKQADWILRDLTKSKLKDVLACVPFLRAITDAKNAEAKKKAHEAYETYRKQLDPVCAEAVDLFLAGMFSEQKDLDSLRTLLQRITEPTRLANTHKRRVGQE